MVAAWAQEEVKGANLRDKRLNERLTAVLSALGERPTASIPAACGGFNDMTAAYRFFSNDKVTYPRILAPHAEQTLRRIAAQPTVLLVQDTTELDFTRPQRQVAGAGPLDGKKRRGALLHPLVAFTPDGTPLGTCWAAMWCRDEPAPGARAQKQKRRRYAPIEEKESRRWLDGLSQARAVAQRCPGARCVCIADSEADVYEWFTQPRGERPVEWLVRAGHDRAVLPGAGGSEARRLRAAVAAAPVLFVQQVTVRGRRAKVANETRGRRQPRETRTAQVEVRACKVTLRGPWRPNAKLPAVAVSAVLVREVSPPAGEVAVEWLLLTTLPIGSVEQVREVVAYYAVRFLVEVFFRVLKSGCRVEGRRFEHVDRMLPCAAVYLIVAWRALMVCRLGRASPGLGCEALFDPAEWKSVWMVVRGERPPRRPPPLSEMVPLIAGLGGHVRSARCTDPPGPQTVWLGLQRMYDFALAWNTFGPGASPTPPPDG
jgi:Transposase DNA-binding/Transposase Tn5 dimerisation domain